MNWVSSRLVSSENWGEYKVYHSVAWLGFIIVRIVENAKLFKGWWYVLKTKSAPSAVVVPIRRGISCVLAYRNATCISDGTSLLSMCGPQGRNRCKKVPGWEFVFCWASRIAQGNFDLMHSKLEHSNVNEKFCPWALASTNVFRGKLKGRLWIIALRNKPNDFCDVIWMATDVAPAPWPNMVTWNIHIFLLQLHNFI